VTSDSVFCTGEGFKLIQTSNGSFRDIHLQKQLRFGNQTTYFNYFFLLESIVCD